MPFARISLYRGKPAAYLQALSQALHGALVERFEVPKVDRFQVIHQHDVGELIFDPDYRSVDTKQRFYLTRVEKLKERTGLNPEDVMVVISTTSGDEWSFGGGRGISLGALRRLPTVPPTLPEHIQLCRARS